MRQSEAFINHPRAVLIVVAILVGLPSVLFRYHQFAPIAAASAQTRHQQIRVRSKRKSKAQSPATNSSSFRHLSHTLPKTKLACSNCHTIPPPKPTEVAVAATAAEVKNYPYHDKCLGCHRVTPPQLFRGTTPIICAVCHTRSSPRLTKRDVSPFPKESAAMILGDLSLMFKHESTNHRRECTICHVNIALVDMAKPDAPISTCATSQCHQKPNVQPSFEQQMLDLEDDDIAGGKNRHACTGCHSTAIAGKTPPCTHYKLFDVDGKYFNIADFPKSAKLIAKMISEQCK